MWLRVACMTAVLAVASSGQGQEPLFTPSADSVGPGYAAPGFATAAPPAPREELPLPPSPVYQPRFQPAPPPPAVPERWTESSWYTRVDYFHWDERIDGFTLVKEDGPLVTLGYQRRVGPERFRVELFGGDVNYDGYGQFDDGTLDPLYSRTRYLGVRGEYDLLWEPDWAPRAAFLVGLGTRFWIRDSKDDYSESGNLITGYQETWWAIYPYLGIETRRTPDAGLEFFGAGRIGFIPITYQHASILDVTLFPRPGLTGQLEGGLRSRHFLLSAFFEAMNWGQSEVVSGFLQPNSRMFTVGLKTGFSF